MTGCGGERHSKHVSTIDVTRVEVGVAIFKHGPMKRSRCNRRKKLIEGWQGQTQQCSRAKTGWKIEFCGLGASAKQQQEVNCCLIM